MNVKDKKHYTPLHAAAAGGQCHAVKMLLELGANVSRDAVQYRHSLPLCILQFCVLQPFGY